MRGRCRSSLSPGGRSVRAVGVCGAWLNSLRDGVKMAGDATLPLCTGSAMRATHLDHVSVIVTDVERSRRFYTDVLGLREIPPPHTFNFVVLWFELGGQTLHLLHKPQPDTISPRHFALHVADIEAARAECRKHGLAIEETVRIPNAD